MFLINPFIYSNVTYLLDDYPATDAFSFRQLKTGVTSVIRVRRESDNAESDFTEAEITNGTLTTWAGGSTGRVTKFYNQGTGTNDLSMGTATSQSAIIISGTVQTKNGKPTIVSDGVNDRMLITAGVSALQSYPFSFFEVGNSEETTTTFTCPWSQRDASSPNQGVISYADRRTAKSSVFIDSGATGYVFVNLSQHDNTNQRTKAFTVSSGGNGEAFYNGVSQQTTASMNAMTIPSATPLYLNYLASSSQYFKTSFQELIIFSTDETANQTAITTNINDYYSIY